MYYPFFRGKQYELITIRECAELMSKSGFVPILEPVKEALGGVEKVLEAVKKAEGRIIVIVNPSYGELPNGKNGLKGLFDKTEGNAASHISPGILLKEDTTVGEISRLIEEYKELPVSLIHAGFSDAAELNIELNKQKNISRHIFFDDKCGKLYRKHFKDLPNILIRDGFNKQVNRGYPDVEFFSDLHATYTDEGMDGFGDFLIVGNEYTETGGPAYAIAVHLTYIDSSKDNEMHVYHFKSIRQDDPKDPAGKFAEALEKLADEVKKPGTQICRTTAVEEFLKLHQKGHFPGLGYVKKLSMKHHIETLAEYFTSVVR
jgi:hypothetical protein